MKLILKISSVIIFLSSCTRHQDQRIRELLTVEKGNFPRTKDIAIVEESLRYKSDEFDLVLETAHPFSTSKGTFPLWILKGNKVPLEERFIFAIIDKVKGTIDPQYEFEVLENGKLLIFDKTGEHTEDRIPFVEARSFLAGSPIQYAIVSKEKYKAATAEFIPYPIEQKGPHGEQIGIEVTHPMGTHFSLLAQNFEPQKTIHLIHSFSDQREEIEIVTDHEGSFALEINPTVFGKMGGEARLQLITDQGEIELTYPWGSWLGKRAFAEKALFPILFVVNPPLEELNPLEIGQDFFSLK